MKILVESGVVESRKEGKWTYYTISEKGSEYATTLLKKLTTPKAVAKGNNCCKTKTSNDNFKTEKHIEII
jgi:ArsR family transcriptional regulator